MPTRSQTVLSCSMFINSDTCSVQRVACSVQRVVCSVQNAVCSVDELVQAELIGPVMQ